MRDRENPRPAPRAAAEVDEAELVRRLRERDPLAFRVLSERYLKRLFNYSNRMLGNTAEAEDVSQETFARFWQRAPAWEAHATVGTWLFRVAHNLCIDRLRQKRPIDSDIELGSDSARPSRMLERRQTAERVRAALAALPDRQRSAVVMSHYEAMSNPEIAAALDVTVESVEGLLGRARRTLRHTLAPTEDST
jgi:RNA polymerase sigma-70 factor (ECF subfamily)